MGGGVKPFDPSKPYETLLLDISAKDITGSGKPFDKRKPNLKMAEDIMNRFLKSIYKKSDGPELEGESIPLKAIAFKSEYIQSNFLGPNSKSKNDYIELTDSNGDTIMFMDDSNGSVAGTGWGELGFYEKGNLVISVNNDFSESIVFIITKENDIQTKTSKTDNKHIELKKEDIMINLRSSDQSEKRASILTQECTVFQFGKKPESDVSLFTALKYCADNSQKLKVTGNEKPSVLASYLGYTVPDNYTPKSGGIKKPGKAS